jgi:hypothetical protein
MPRSFRPLPILALMLSSLPLASAAQDIFPLATGAWTCLTPQGTPAFAFTISDDGIYADPAGAEGNFAQPGPGMIELLTGPWAGTMGSHVPGGPMALMLPDGKVPAICLAPPA